LSALLMTLTSLVGLIVDPHGVRLVGIPPGTPAWLQSIARESSMMPVHGAAYSGRPEIRNQKPESNILFRAAFLISGLWFLVSRLWTDTLSSWHGGIDDTLNVNHIAEGILIYVGRAVTNAQHLVHHELHVRDIGGTVVI